MNESKLFLFERNNFSHGLPIKIITDSTIKFLGVSSVLALFYYSFI